MTPFTPRPAATVNIDVSSSTQNVLVATDPGVKQVRIMNNGTATAWVAFGGSTVTATTTANIPVGPGVTEVMTLKKSDGPLYAAAIAAGSTGKIYFTPGIGI